MAQHGADDGSSSFVFIEVHAALSFNDYYDYCLPPVTGENI